MSCKYEASVSHFMTQKIFLTLKTFPIFDFEAYTKRRGTVNFGLISKVTRLLRAYKQNKAAKLSFLFLQYIFSFPSITPCPEPRERRQGTMSSLLHEQDLKSCITT